MSSASSIPFKLDGVELQALPGQMTQSARLARLGESDAVAELERTRTRFAGLMQTLGEGGSHAGGRSTRGLRTGFRRQAIRGTPAWPSFLSTAPSLHG